MCFRRLYIRLFVVIVLTFLIIFITKINRINISEQENRSLTKKPEFNRTTILTGTYSKQFEQWLNDRFRGRYKLITLLNHLEQLINGRVENAMTFEGKDGFLFYKGENSIANFQNKIILTDAELLKIKEILEKRKQYLARRGISFYVMIAPDKNRVYAENYPSYIHKIRSKGRAEQLVCYLQEQGFNIIYPLQELRDARKIGGIYYRLDTHWNTYAAYIAYDIIMRTISKDMGIQCLVWEDFLVGNEMEGLAIPHYKRNDLVKMANISSKYCKGHFMNTLKIDKKIPYKYKFVKFEGMNGEGGVETVNSNSPNKLKLLVFRDSFAMALEPLLSETFAHSIYIWDQNFNNPNYLKMIDDFKPNIVIEEVVERSLQQLLMDTPPLKEAN